MLPCLETMMPLTRAINKNLVREAIAGYIFDVDRGLLLTALATKRGGKMTLGFS